VNADLAPDAAAARNADHERLIRRLMTAARRTARGSDPEAIHDTRVAVRRAEAALDLYRDALAPRRRRRARRALAGLRDALGAARECQVSAALLTERLPALGATEHAAAAELVRRLTRRRRRLERDAARSCRRRVIARTARRLRRAFASLPSLEGEAWLDSARARAAARLERARSALAQPFEGAGDEGMHRARIAVKRARYALELLNVVEPVRDSGPLEELKTLQERLGAIHDLAMVHERVTRRARKIASAGAELAGGLRDLAARLEAEAADFGRKLKVMLARSTRIRTLGVIDSGARPSRTA